MAEQATTSTPAASDGAPPSATKSTAVTQANPEENQASGGALFDLSDFGDRVIGSIKRGELGFALGLIMILVVLIMPLPA